MTMLFSFSACMKDDFVESKSQATIALDKSNLPTTFTVSNLKLTLKESNSGSVYTVPVDISKESASTEVNFGTYAASLEGDILVSENGKEKKMRITARKEAIVVNANTVSIDLKLFLSDPSANFVFKEIFYTGNRTPENKAYHGDKYFILQNNSNDTLYADGLLIAQSYYLTTTMRVYTPAIMDEAFTTQQIIMIPGDGDDYPVYPGEDFIIANNAINHLQNNTNSLDLTQADVEIELLSNINVDNPAVPNTISVAGNLLMHDRGFTGYVLARLPQGLTVEAYKKDYAYTLSYIATNGREISVEAYKIPNSNIIDAVNLSVSEGYEWLVTSAALDMGWTYCGTTNSDQNRYGKSVIRKSLGKTIDGKDLLKDTNNSAEDFQAESSPSLKK